MTLGLGRTPRRAGRLAVLAVLALVTAGCGGGGDAEPSADPPTRAKETPTATPEEPTKEPAESAEPTEEPTTEEPETPSGIVLNGAGVGGIAFGTPDPRAALEALLGPPQAEWPDVQCGPGDVDALQWGALSVSTLDGNLWGWDIQPRRGALPAGVVVESGVTPYQSLGDALALPGATTPEYMGNLDMLYVTAGGVQYFGSGSDAATSEVQLVGVNVVICG